MKSATLYCVVFRTGGTENFRWHRSLPASHAAANTVYERTCHMGYRAYLVQYDMSLAIGLPDTFE